MQVIRGRLNPNKEKKRQFSLPRMTCIDVKLLFVNVFFRLSLLFSSVLSRFDPNKLKVPLAFLLVIYSSSDGTLVGFGANLLLFLLIYSTSDGSLEGVAKAGISVLIIPYFIGFS